MYLIDTNNCKNMSRFIFFGAFMVFIILMLAMDLGLFHKKDHEIKSKEAAIWTCIWVLLAMGMALLIRFRAEWVHGINSMEELLAFASGTSLEALIQPGMDFASALDVYRKEMANQFLAGYFLEESLSIDNIFVMIMIFVSFGIDKKYYHRVLFWGILGAIILRFAFIFLLGAVVARFSWILAIFGWLSFFVGGGFFSRRLFCHGVIVGRRFSLSRGMVVNCIMSVRVVSRLLAFCLSFRMSVIIIQLVKYSSG